MADIIDVQNALVAAAAQVLYPNGTGQSSAVTAPVRIYPGWPNAASLDADLSVGTCHVSVFPSAAERNTSRYPKDWLQQTINAPTLTMTISGQTVTVGGTIPPSTNPHNVMVLADGQPYAYAVQTADTLTSIATALAALIAVGISGTTSSGPVITLPAPARIEAARVGITGTMIREIRRQDRQFQITAWADTPAHRDAIAQTVDVALAATEFLTMPDGYAARLIYRGSTVIDSQQKAGLYRRDLIYTVEYATTQTATATQVTQEQINVTAQDGTTAQISIVNQLNL
ncbi:MAG: hypothetical protein M0Z99_12975 [Betaproteobacteria bacterium]|nr:hypothetical protein [Betaproteobacteria bacterium]